VVLKPDFFRLMADIAVKKLARNGHKAPAGFSLVKEQESVFGPRGHIQANPSTPRMFSEMYDTAPFFSKFFGIRKNPVAASLEVDLFQQFKSSVQHISALYFRRHGVGREKFEFPKGQGNTEALKAASLNQYRNYIMSGVVLELIRLAYEITPSEIDEILKLTGPLAMSFNQLNNKQNRVEFGQSFHRILASIFGDQKLGPAIIARLGKKEALPGGSS
jgi:hypothetical protein